MKMFHGQKIWLRLVIVISVVLVMAWSCIVWWVYAQQREMGIRQAHEFSLSVNQMVMAGLTGMMITGTVGQRSVYLDQIQHAENIRELRVLRSEALDKQYPAAKTDNVNPDAIEQSVLKSGKPYFELLQDAQGESLRAVVPSLNEKDSLGKNCVQCHEMEGAVLGAVSMKISLEGVNSAVRKSSLEVVAVALGLMIVVIVCIYLFINRALTVPLRKLSHSLSEIADGDGDLTRRLEVHGKDEIAETSAIFNTFMNKLHSVVREVKLSAEQVLATATQLAGASQQVTVSSDRQSDATASMAAAIEEITVSVGHVADNAQSAQQMAVEAGGLSGQGAVAVRNAVSEMNKIADSVVRSAEVIRELGDKSAQISSIVNVIQGIAEQTNLLALNAAIEAARAGEQGRGFAVVADEVRKLAERTTTSTQQIGTMIGAIQSGTQVAVQNMEAGSAQVQEGVRLAAQAGDSMNRIELSSGNVCEAVETISSALREQNSASIQIAQSVEQIARMTEQNSAVAKESSQSAGHLERLAATLKTSVDRFKV